jgi:hypothetical protein
MSASAVYCCIRIHYRCRQNYLYLLHKDSLLVAPSDNAIPRAVGEEGFYPAGSPNAAKYNPGEEFSTTSGQDFVQNHSPDTIDFAATHIWIGEMCSL